MKALKKNSPTSKVSPKAAPQFASLSERVREETLEALLKVKIIGPEERAGFQKYLISKSISSGDILPVMAHLRGIEEDERSDSIKKWARAIAPVVKKRYALVPFAGKLISQATFFDNRQELHKEIAPIKCPLIYAEDSDALGFGTINPVAGACMADHLGKRLKEATGLLPYISVFLLDLPTWNNSCERQFAQ